MRYAIANDMQSFHLAVISSSEYTPPWTEGVRNLTRRLAQDFSARGAQITIIAPASGNPQAVTEPGIRVEELNNLPQWQGGHSLKTIPAYLRLLLETAIKARRLRPQPQAVLILASVSSMLGLRTRLIKLFSRRPLVLFITGLSKQRKRYRLGLAADKVLVGGDFLKGWFPEAEVLYPFLPISIDPASKNTGRAPGPFNVAFLGSFEPGRGVEFLLKAMKQVCEQAQAPVRLMIGWNGTCSENYDHIVRMIGDLGLQLITDLYGHVDATWFYRQADVIVIPRLTQEYMSFPVRIVEALSMQTPLIVTRVCGMEQLIAGCGLSVEPGDVDGLAKAILDLVDDPGLTNQFKANCPAALQRFDSQASLDRLYQIVKDLAKV